MKLRMATLIAAVLALLIASDGRAETLLLCGGSELFEIDPAAKDTPKLWRWSGDEVAEFSATERRAFHHLDECKPLADGKLVLVSASNGGCALIERPSGRVRWHATASNAHSLDLLPRDRVVVASSLGGDHLVLFDLSSSEPLWKTPLRSAHGVVWDEARQCLWALGFAELRRYELRDWKTAKPSLALLATHKLPSDDGHDLRAVPSSPDLLMTADNHVWLFDREREAFRPHPLLGDQAGIKAVDIHPQTGRIVVGDWRSTIRFYSPEGTIDTRPARPYKVRWLVDPQTPVPASRPEK